MEYVYAALILHKLGKEINEVSLKKVLEAAGANVDEGKIKALVSALKGIDIEKELKEAAVAPVAAVSTGDPKEVKKEEKKEEEDKKGEEQAAAGLGALFG
ncbi:50S ribosomal protein P1 [Candidatus Woesearchaeota archaeon]|nr:50S ribosomal protein P1 [Candidatus Woesearchaeota archaeon]